MSLVINKSIDQIYHQVLEGHLRYAQYYQRPLQITMAFMQTFILSVMLNQNCGERFEGITFGKADDGISEILEGQHRCTACLFLSGFFGVVINGVTYFYVEADDKGHYFKHLLNDEDVSDSYKTFLRTAIASFISMGGNEADLGWPAVPNPDFHKTLKCFDTRAGRLKEAVLPITDNGSVYQVRAQRPAVGPVGDATVC